MLFRHREKRIKPGLDDKLLTAWNALTISGYTQAFEATAEKRYRKQALATAHFIKDKQLQADGRLNRNYKNGVTSINAFPGRLCLQYSGFY